MLGYFLNPIKNDYANFKGRTGRKAYWMFILVYVILSIVVSIVESILETTLISMIFSLVLLLPTLSIGVRRMHDVGKSGWFVLVPLYNLYLHIQPSEEGTNKWGDKPQDN